MLTLEDGPVGGVLRCGSLSMRTTNSCVCHQVQETVRVVAKGRSIVLSRPLRCCPRHNPASIMSEEEQRDPAAKSGVGEEVGMVD